MESFQYFVGLRLDKELELLLGALVRRSGKSRSQVIRELIAKGYVRERINKEHIQLIRQLTGEATNLNQLARKANTFGYHDVARKCEETVDKINVIIKKIRNDG